MDLGCHAGQVLLPEIKTLDAQPIAVVITYCIFIGLHFDLAIPF
jgi:hypothetical protein